uniref:Reverse transcriptase domain-containing protein n=1 Tax=Cuerna arida TaxID=1464854 RepID=A0A1B6FLH7_9HEMI
MLQFWGKRDSIIFGIFDDTTLLLKNESPDDLSINTFIALNMCYQYCHMNDLVVNPLKTKQIIFGRRSEAVPVVPEILQENETTFLGLRLDNQLSWNTHVDELCKKLSSAVYVVRRIMNVADTDTARVAYFAMFESRVRYGLIVWGGTSATNLNRVLTLQKRAIRAIAGLNPMESCREAFKSYKIKTVIALYIEQIILHAASLNLPTGHTIHSYNTRHGSDYTLPLHRLTLTEKKPSYRGAKLYNNLPDDIRGLTGETLQKKLSSWILQHPFYNLQEFLHGID